MFSHSFGLPYVSETTPYAMLFEIFCEFLRTVLKVPYVSDVTEISSFGPKNTVYIDI